jgi:hypothetical protein
VCSAGVPHHASGSDAYLARASSSDRHESLRAKASLEPIAEPICLERNLHLDPVRLPRRYLLNSGTSSETPFADDRKSEP